MSDITLRDEFQARDSFDVLTEESREAVGAKGRRRLMPAPKGEDDPGSLAGGGVEIMKNFSILRSQLIGDPISLTIPFEIGEDNAFASRAAGFHGRPALEWAKFRGIIIRHRWRRILSSAVSWLIRFQELTEGDALIPAEMLHRTGVLMEVETYLNRKGDALDPLAVRSLKALRDQAASEAEALPLCSSHGDFHFGRFTTENGNIAGVIDWSGFESRSHPFHDFWQLMIQSAGAGSRDPDAFVSESTSNLFGLGWMNSTIAGQTERFCKNLGVSSRIAREFLPFHLVRLSLREGRNSGSDPRMAGAWDRLLESILVFETSRGGFLEVGVDRSLDVERMQ